MLRESQRWNAAAASDSPRGRAHARRTRVAQPRIVVGRERRARDERAALRLALLQTSTLRRTIKSPVAIAIGLHRPGRDSGDELPLEYDEDAITGTIAIVEAANTRFQAVGC